MANGKERQKKEYRMANANVGDKPQIEEDLSDEEDLFGENELTADGRRLKRMIKKRRDPKDKDLFGSDTDDVRPSLTAWDVAER